MSFSIGFHKAYYGCWIYPAYSIAYRKATRFLVKVSTRSIRRMGRHKNKPKKGGAAVSPAEIPTGETEVIVPATATAIVADAPATVVVAADTPAPLPTFTQIGMAGMIGMLGSATPVPAAVASEPLAPAETTTEPAAASEETAATEPVESLKRSPSPGLEEKPECEEKQNEEKLSDTINESLNNSLQSPKKEIEPTVGFYGYIKNFFRSIGGAINR